MSSKSKLCGRSANLAHLDLGDRDLERRVANEIGRAEERDRIRAIFEAEEAVGRFELAKVLALDTDVPVDAALATLARVPRQSPKGRRA